MRSDQKLGSGHAGGERADIALRQSEGYYREIADHVQDLIWAMDLSGRFIHANAAVNQMHGWTIKEFLNLTIHDVVPPKQTVHFTTLLEECRLSATTKQDRKRWSIFESEFLRKDGSVFWGEVRAVPLWSDGNKPAGIIGTTRDITKQQEREDALRMSEALYHTLIEQMPAGVFRKDRQGRFVLVNSWFCRLRGMSADEILGKTPEELIVVERGKHGESRPEISLLLNEGTQHHKRIMHTGERIESEEEYPAVNGRKKFMSVVKMPVVGPGEKIIGTQGILFDVTERKQVEEALRRSEERYHQITKCVPDLIWTMDLLGRFTYVNSAVERMFGWTAEEFLKLNYRETIPPQQVPRLEVVLEEELAKVRSASYDHNRIRTVELEGLRKDGSTFSAEVRAGFMWSDDGKPVGIVGSTRDITERRKLEAQFRQAQKMEAVGQLAGGVAHDFNNLLTVIRGNIFLLQLDDTKPEERAACLDGIAKAAEHATMLTSQLLQFSRKQDMQAFDMDLNEVITHLAKLLQRVLGEDIQMQFKLASRPLIIHADPVMLDQILMNLAVNSRDAMPNGGRLIIETAVVKFDEASAAQTAQARPGTFACLNVSDNGCGIAPEILPRIFEPFFTTKDVGRGTGLGLATVFGIVQQHEGWITVYSQPGTGTTFRIYLPRLEKAVGSETVKETTPVLRGHGETILLVEDDALVRKLVHNILIRLGYRVLEADNGVNALEVWRQNMGEIRLLLTNLIMPEGINGRKLAEKLLLDNPRLKVIYTSGYSAGVFGVDFPLQEGTNYLIKPFQAHRLAQVIHSALDAG